MFLSFFLPPFLPLAISVIWTIRNPVRKNKWIRNLKIKFCRNKLKGLWNVRAEEALREHPAWCSSYRWAQWEPSIRKTKGLVQVYPVFGLEIQLSSYSKKQRILKKFEAMHLSQLWGSCMVNFQFCLFLMMLKSAKMDSLSIVLLMSNIRTFLQLANIIIYHR